MAGAAMPEVLAVFRAKADVGAAIAKMKLMGQEFKKSAKEATKGFDTNLSDLSDKADALSGVLRNVGLTSLRYIGTGGALVMGLHSVVAVAGTAIVTMRNLAGAVAVLPAAAAGAAFAIGTLKVGTYGLSDAFAALSGDAKEYADATKGLAPNARKFTDAIRGLRPQLKSLKDSVQNALFYQFGDIVKALGARLLPTLKRNMTGTAMALNVMASEAARAVLSARGIATLDAIGKAVWLSFANLDRAIGPVVDGLLAVARVGADALPKMADIVADVATNWGRWLTKAADSGQVTRWIHDAWQAMKDLYSITKSVSTILGTVFDFLSQGATPLGIVAKGLKSIADNLSRKDLEDILGPILDGVASGAGHLSEAGPAVKQILEDLGPLLGTMADAVGKMGKGALEQIATDLDDWKGPLGAVAQFLDDHGEQLGKLAVDVLELSLAIKAVSLALALLDVALDMNPIVLVITVILALGLAFYQAWQSSETFRNNVRGIMLMAAMFMIQPIQKAIGWFQTLIEWFKKIWGFAGMIPGPVGSAFRSTFSTVSTWVGKINGVLSSLKGAIQGVIGKFTDMLSFESKAKGAALSIGKYASSAAKVPFGHADGTTYSPGGVRLVGERGPELAFLPRGTGVATHSQTMRLMSGVGARTGGGGGAGPATVDVPIVLALDGDVLYRGVQRVALRYGVRNGASGLSFA
jgi:phage-related protein